MLTFGKYSSSQSRMISTRFDAIDDIKAGSNENIIELINSPLELSVKMILSKFEFQVT